MEDGGWMMDDEDSVDTGTRYTRYSGMRRITVQPATVQPTVPTVENQRTGKRTCPAPSRLH